jgi:lysozyme
VIDVYEGQGVIDWHKVKVAGVERAYLKAWEYRLDGQFVTNAHHATAAGVQIGAYCFGHPSLDAATQAREFVQVIKPFLTPGSLPPCLDLEVDDGHTIEWCIRWKTDWFAVVDQAAGCRAVLYSDRYWLNAVVPHIYPDRPVWGAVYGGALTDAEQARWSFHQYTSTGKVPGIAGTVDLDAVLHPDAVPVIPSPAV